MLSVSPRVHSLTEKAAVQPSGIMLRGSSKEEDRFILQTSAYINIHNASWSMVVNTQATRSRLICSVECRKSSEAGIGLLHAAALMHPAAMHANQTDM